MRPAPDKQTLCPRRLRRVSKGFTLLELIVVMTILAIISAAVVPMYGRSLAAIQLRSVRNDFVSLLSFVQARAVAESREYRVYIDSREGVYWVMYFDGVDDKEEKVFQFVEAEYGQEHAIPQGYEIKSVSAPKDRNYDAYYIACYPNGACDNNATVSFKNVQDGRGFEVTTTGAMGKFEVK